MAELERIEMYIKDEQEDGVFAVSLVESPAIEENFIALSKHKIDLKVVDEERRIVVGFALVPEKEIYRKMKINGEDKEFNIFFSKDTVAKTAHLYMKNLNQANVTAEHEKPVTDCTVVETWMVEDAKNDKSNIWNLGAQGGEWCIMMKIDNNEEWEDIKEGKKLGFSIEGAFQGFEQLASKQPTDEEIINQIKNIING